MSHFQLACGTYLDMDRPEPDVYIERVDASGDVWRVTKGDSDAAKPAGPNGPGAR